MANQAFITHLTWRLERQHDVDEKLPASALLAACRAALIEANGGEDDAHELEAHRLRAELAAAYEDSGYIIGQEEGEPAYYVNALRVVVRRLSALHEAGSGQ